MTTTIQQAGQVSATAESRIQEYKSLQTPSLILSSMRCISYEDVLKSDHLTIGEMSKRSDNNRKFMLSYISTAIISYLNFIGRRNTMDDVQVADTAELILTEYPRLKLDDIALFIRKCKLSHFGKLYDLSGAVLLDWLNMYINERKQALHALYEREEEERRKRQPAREYTEEERVENIRNAEEMARRVRKHLFEGKV